MSSEPGSKASWRPVVLATAVLGLAAALTGLASALDADKWIQATLAGFGVIGAIVLPILDWIHERREADARRRELWRRPPQRVGELSRDDDSPYALGVETEARGALEQVGVARSGRKPYVQRDVDVSGELASKLSNAAHHDEATVVIVSGPSKAGKTRTLYEAMATTLGDAWLIVPKDAAALAALARGGPPKEIAGNPCAVWLDDVEPFARPDDGLNQETLAHFGTWRRPVILLATAGGKGVRHPGAEDFSDAAREIIRRFPPIRLRAELSEDERARARDTYDTPVASDIAVIGEFMIAAEELVDRYEQGTSREGIAVTRAAVDWRRAGLLRPVPREALEELYAFYLTGEPSARSFRRGLKWATTPLYARVALLREDGGYEPYDYIASYETRGVADDMWEALIERYARGVEFSDVGVSADALGELDFAERAFRAGDKAGDAGSASNLAVLLERRGEVVEAEAARRRAGDHARQAFDLGYTSQSYENAVMLEQAGNIEAAEEFYRTAQASSDPEVATRAAQALARLTNARGS